MLIAIATIALSAVVATRGAVLNPFSDTFAGGVSGTVTRNQIPKVAGSSKIADSSINDDGTTVTISEPVTVTGALNGPFGATRVTASTQAITAAMSGRLFAVANASDAATVLTLPAASTAGLRYCFAADDISGSNKEVKVETPAGSDLIIGTTNAAGATGIATTAGASHGIKNTHATAVRGNAVCIQADGTNTWYMTSLSGTWAAY
jgi:hypothetical protein